MFGLGHYYPSWVLILQVLAVVQKLRPRDPNQDAEAPPGDIIQTITIEAK